ncbi:hypothetical protein CYJ22_04215 [Schaalia odontolytica]|jgi:hypothetical protein|uniref:Uncharacterized protein n=1 Tax=Schaalia odontolytica TaxID=1660 RepID=A0A2I1I0F4_9ACTO|nr:hypothetical protein CYJ22_04215 [Schaalia odontolytica]
MLLCPKGDAVSNSTALIALVGLAIALVWAWAWFGIGASARRVSVRLELGAGHAAGEMGRVVWPLMPLLSLLWFLTADLMAREARGLDTLGSLGLVIGVLALMGAAAVQALYFGGLPAWAYPGWMARRYYASHPGARERELGTRAVI